MKCLIKFYIMIIINLLIFFFFVEGVGMYTFVFLFYSV